MPLSFPCYEVNKQTLKRAGEAVTHAHARPPPPRARTGGCDVRHGREAHQSPRQPRLRGEDDRHISLPAGRRTPHLTQPDPPPHLPSPRSGEATRRPVRLCMHLCPIHNAQSLACTWRGCDLNIHSTFKSNLCDQLAHVPTDAMKLISRQGGRSVPASHPLDDVDTKCLVRLLTRRAAWQTSYLQIALYSSKKVARVGLFMVLMQHTAAILVPYRC